MTRPSEAEFEQFIKLVRTHSDLLSATQSSNGLAAPVEKLPPTYTQELKSHAVYRWLERSDSYTKAAQAFASRQPSNLGPRWTAVEELQFVNAVVTWAHGAFIALENDWQPQTISAARRRSTLIKLKALLGDIHDGVDFENGSDSIQLRQVLYSFRSELRKPRKRDHSGVGARERYFCVLVGQALASVHDLSNKAAVEILQHFADLVGLTVSHRSAQRYMDIAGGKVAERRRRNERRLATGK